MKMKIELTPTPIIEAKSEVSIRSESLEEEKKVVLDWSRQNNALAKKMEHELKDRFESVIVTLPQHDVPEARLSIPFPRSYLFGRSTSTFGSSHSVLKGAASTSTIHSEEQSIISAPESEATTTSVFMAKKLASLNVSGLSKKANPINKPPAKKAVYIPAGYERDLPDFAKYNQI